VRTSRTAFRSVAVFGTCAASAVDIARLAIHGVPDDVVGRWPGSYVVVQIMGDTTTVWTDFGGACPIYVLTVDGGLFWASSSRALSGLTGQRLDSGRLAASLLAPEVLPLSRGRSMFAGISLVPAAYRATLSIAGGLDVEEVWRPRPQSGDVGARLRKELSAAVAVRVGSAEVTTSDLSGGLDSTALALLAAQRSTPDHAVTAVTVHPDGVTSGGDLTYVREAVEHAGLSHRMMPLLPDHLPYGALDRIPATDEPAPSTIAYARFSAQLVWMREQLRSDCHLTGDGGDSLMCATPIMLADLLAGGRLRRAVVEAMAWARVRRTAAWPLLVSAARTTRISRTSALRLLADSWRAPRLAEPTSAGTGRLHTWFVDAACPIWATREARELAGVLAAEVADRSDPMPQRDFSAYLTAELMADVGRSARADGQLAEHHGIALHNPIIDSRVIDAYLSGSLDRRPGPADYKPIIRRAMRDLFPPSLAARTTKGSFTSDYYEGLRANLPDLIRLADGHLAVLGLIDPMQFRHTLKLAAAGVGAAFAAVEPVVVAETWLRVLDSTPPVRWVTLEERQTPA
jgi:asparagine synthase (glutamine-hydrolysing)